MNIMDLERWKKKYSFLEKVSDLFEEYNRNVNVEKGSIYTSCDTIWDNRVRYVFKNHEFCPKLMRNIWLIYKKTEEDMGKSVRRNIDMTRYERCTNLNKWIYYNLKKVPVPEKIIEQIFKITHNMLNVIPGSYKYNKHTILEILKNKHQPHYDVCVKYIRECANTYKKMKKEHCINCDRRDIKCVKTCAELDVFEDTYMLELRDLLDINTGILNLKNTEMDADIQLELEEELLEEVDDVELDAEGNSDYLINFLQGNITKGAGITGGAGAFLFFLFRFTPAGKWFHSGKRTPEVENILEGGPSEELFLNDPYYMHMNSDTTRYNVGYGST